MTSVVPVNEVYTSIADASWTGTMSVVIRLQGCDVGCAFCDVPYSWDLDPRREITLAAMLARQADSSGYAAVGVSTLVSTIDSFNAHHVVITGGEPCRYDLTELTSELIAAGYTVQIETSGTEPVLAHSNAWVTVSPKLDMPGGRKVLPEAIAAASEINVPVGKASDIEKFIRFRNTLPPDTLSPSVPIWLQPLSGNPKAMRLCIDTCLRFGWRLSVQIHKFIGVR